MLSFALFLSPKVTLPKDSAFDECPTCGAFSVVYAIDFSEMTDAMAAMYQGADVWIADCLTRRP